MQVQKYVKGPIQNTLNKAEDTRPRASSALDTVSPQKRVYSAQYTKYIQSPKTE